LREREQSKQFEAKNLCRVHIVITKLNTQSKILSAENHLTVTARGVKKLDAVFEIIYLFFLCRTRQFAAPLEVYVLTKTLHKISL
jgi:hypothetical protein